MRGVSEQYHKYRPQIETGDLIEMKSNSLIGWLIRLVTGKPVNHTAVVIRMQEYYSNRVFILEALETGIVLNPLSRRIANFKGAVYWLPLKKEYALSRAIIGKNALGYVGIGYDYLSIIKQLIGRVSADARRLFCSEHAYLSLLHAGLPVEREKVPVPGEMVDLGVFEQPIMISGADKE